MTNRSVDRLFARWIRRGDPEALAGVFDSTAAELLRVARHLVRDEAAAEDLVQDTFLRAIERAATFRVGERVVPWLTGILVNAARGQHRRRRVEDVSELGPEHASESTDDPAAAAHDREVAARVRDALAGVPEPYRDVLHRHLELGQGGEEIGRATGRSPNTVRSQLRRGLGMLRAALPAGFAVACQPTATRGLAAVREVVITRAAALPSAVAVTTSGTWIGIALMMKKNLALVAAVLVVAVTVLWVDPFGMWTGPESDARAGVVTVEEPARDAVTTGAAADEVRDRAVVGTPGQTETAVALDPLYRAALAGVRGRVVGPDAQPRPGARVRLFRLESDLGSLAQSVMAGADPGSTVVADELGRFAFAEVEPRASFALVVTDRAVERLKIVESTPGPGQDVDIGDVEIGASIRLTGRVADGDGVPQPGVTVRAIDAAPVSVDLFGLRGLHPQTRHVIWREGVARVIEVPEALRRVVERLAFCAAETDAQGRFELTGVRPGPNTVFAFAAGCQPAYVSVEAQPDGGDVGTLTLQPGVATTVRVVDAAGRAVAGAQVLVAARGRGLPVEYARACAETDARGVTGLAGASPGGGSVAVRRGPDQPWLVSTFEDAAVPIEVALPVQHRLNVTVRDLASGQPLLDVAVRVAPLAAAEHAATDTDPDWLDLPSARTGAGGAVEFAALDAGAYLIEVSPPDSNASPYSAQRARIELASDLTRTFSLDAVPESVVRVVGPGSVPVAAARVLIRSAGPGPGPGSDPAAFGAVFSPRRVRTDRQGEARVAGVRGLVELRVSHPAFGVQFLEASWPAPLTVVTLAETGAISGRVEPPPAPDGPRPRIRVTPVAVGDAAEAGRLMVVDEAGGFVVTGLTPGDYHVDHAPSLESVRSVGAALYQVSAAPMRPVPVAHRVEPGGVTRVVLPAEGSQAVRPQQGLRGIVRVDGLAAAGCRVVVLDGQIHRTTLDASGRFDFDAVKGSRFMLSVIRPPSPARGQAVLWRKRFDGVDAQFDPATDLVIDVRTGGLRGRLLDAEGNPVVGAAITGSGTLDGPRGPAVNCDATTSEGGHFAFVDVPAGSYELKAYFDGASPVLARDVVVSPGSVGRELTFRLP